MPEKRSREEILEWVREFQEQTRQFAETDRELRIRFQVLTEQKEAVTARMRAKLGL